MGTHRMVSERLSYRPKLYHLICWTTLSPLVEQSYPTVVSILCSSLPSLQDIDHNSLKSYAAHCCVKFINSQAHESIVVKRSASTRSIPRGLFEIFEFSILKLDFILTR